MEIKNFLISLEHAEIFESLSDEQAGKLIKMVFNYVKGEKIENIPLELKIAFISVRQYIDKCKIKYEDTCNKRREAANKRWMAEKNRQNKEINEDSSLITPQTSPPRPVYDITCNPHIDKCFDIYKEYCKDLKPLKYERRSRDIMEMVARFLDETQMDFDYFKDVCKKANDQKTICDNALDFKGVLKNHISIYNEKFKKGSSGKVVSKLKFK